MITEKWPRIEYMNLNISRRISSYSYAIGNVGNIVTLRDMHSTHFRTGTEHMYHTVMAMDKLGC